ncbi:MAG: hypothetical protein R2862_02770 [Thermoanaerobaculia bacterium]
MGIGTGGRSRFYLGVGRRFFEWVGLTTADLHELEAERPLTHRLPCVTEAPRKATSP